MKPPSKKMILAFLVVILIFVVLSIVLPEKQTEPSAANLIVISDTDLPIGSIGVSYARYDGSQVSENCVNADGSMILRGGEAYFNVSWPVTVTIYADLQGREELLFFVVEEEPEENCVWQATITDSPDGLIVSMEFVPEAEDLE